MQLSACVDKWQIMEGGTLCKKKKIVKDVILVAKHEFRANTEVVNMQRA